jgi:hypothetical protein
MTKSMKVDPKSELKRPLHHTTFGRVHFPSGACGRRAAELIASNLATANQETADRSSPTRTESAYLLKWPSNDLLRGWRSDTFKTFKTRLRGFEGFEG